MTRVRALPHTLFAACVVVLSVASLAMAEDERLEAVPYAYDDYEAYNGAEFEEVAPPAIDYEEFAGPDPVLEGSTPSPAPPATAAEQRIQELRGEVPPPGAAGPEPPADLGARSVLDAVMALCIVLGLIVLLLYAVRRFGVRTPLLAGANLGKVLGRVHLTPKASLHFVRTGGKVLVVGVTQESVQLVETFDAEAFDTVDSRIAAEETADADEDHPKAVSFLSQLREQSNRMRQPVEQPRGEDGDIATLRGDIERLQRMLRDATRE